MTVALADAPSSSDWKEYELGEILTLINGRAYKKEELLDKGTPVLRIQNLNGGNRWYYSNLNLPTNKYCDNGDLLFAWSASFGPYIWGGGKAIYHYHIWKIETGKKLDKKFAYYLLQSITDRVKSAGRGISMLHMTKSGMEAWKVRIPPLAEQKRIAGILDQADGLRRLRQRALDKLNTLGQSIFYDMFGDPNAEDEVFPRKEIGEVCHVGSGSTPSRKEPGFYNGDIPWVKTTEVRGKIIYSTEELITAEGMNAANLKEYPVGTVLIAMYGQGKTRGQVGMLATRATVNQACAALVPNDLVDRDFLFEQLKISYERLRRLGQGGNQPNLNAGLVRGFSIIVPSISEQRNFVETIANVRSNLQLAERSLASQVQLFASLQQRAFRGEL